MTLIRDQVALNSSSFVAITAPCEAESLQFSNDENGANDIYTRTDTAVAATQRRFLAGSYQVYRKEDGTTIKKGDTLFHAKTVTGSFNVNTEWKS